VGKGVRRSKLAEKVFVLSLVLIRASLAPHAARASYNLSLTPLPQPLKSVTDDTSYLGRDLLVTAYVRLCKIINMARGST
jgi:hypothetical protein